MKRSLFPWSLLGLLLLVAPSLVADVIVYTAHQDWLSRIYIMEMDGTVRDYFEYSFYRLVDVEVVNNELYVAEAFAPRSYRVDLLTGDLDLVIDDWSLYYFYDLAFDGTYFYVTEWDLNRYDIEGDRDGTASFNEDVMGSAWDGAHLWTLDNANHIKCWDLAGWPTVTEVPENAFNPPTSECRGLWFDGENFWTTESKDVLGYIYKFDTSGQVLRQWLQPAFSGWAACVIQEGVSGLDDRLGLSSPRFLLAANSPNPFNPVTNISFELPSACYTTLQIFNLQGEQITTLLAAELGTGQHTVAWNATDVASGVYLYRLQAGDKVLARKMVLAR